MTCFFRVCQRFSLIVLALHFYCDYFYPEQGETTFFFKLLEYFQNKKNTFQLLFLAILNVSFIGTFLAINFSFPFFQFVINFKNHSFILSFFSCNYFLLSRYMLYSKNIYVQRFSSS